MPCYSPLKGYRSSTINPSGKRGIVFNKKDGFIDRPIEIPCGQCIGCKLERSRQWALRIMNEASLYEENCFITLTYNPENLPQDCSLHVEHYQKFMKRLRKKYDYKTIRFFHCGEYGEQNLRPHYHAILFNHSFKDQELFRSQETGNLYTSNQLGKLWPYGFSTIGECSFDTAAYVARYVTKKITGKGVDIINPETGLKPYERYDSETGEIITVKPEYTTMSRGGRAKEGENLGGIGKRWYEKYKHDCWPSDFLIQNGKKMQPPKYYDNLLEKEHEQEYKKIKQGRRKRALKRKDENTTERLLVKEKCKIKQMSSFNRNIED